MRVVVISVGKAKEPAMRQMIDDYLARIRRYVACDEVELRDGRGVEQAMMAAIPSQAHVVALEVRGKQFTSEAFSSFLVARGAEQKGVVAFLIGGAEGIPSKVSQNADTLMSLSSFTLAHRVARVVLMEQLYRAVSIWKGLPYHRGEA